MRRVAFHPEELMFRRIINLKKTFPQVNVSFVLESSLLPFAEPSEVDGVDHVFAVGKNFNRQKFIRDAFQSDDYRHKFHSVVSGSPESCTDLFAVRAKF